MKTDQLMTVCFPQGDLHISHKSMMGSLTDLFNIGNKIRVMEGKGIANMTLFVNSASTQEFIRIICEEQACHPDSVITKTGRGKSSRTEANLHLLIYAAEYLSTRFHYQVVDTFITGKLLQHRDESGDRYKPFNMAIDQLPDRVGKDNKWLYVHAANLLAERIGLPAVSEMPVDDKGKPLNRWNAATAHQLSERADAEKMLTSMVQFGVVRDWEHLKELIGKV